MKSAKWQIGICHLLLICSLLTSTASAKPPETFLPQWESLQFEQQAFGLTATSNIELGIDPNDEHRCLLLAASSLANVSEIVELRLDAENGRVLQRSRFSKGRDQRFKSYDYLDDHVRRERREPDGNPELPPTEWPLSGSLKIPYPAAAAGYVITSSYALLPLAQQFNTEKNPVMEVVVHTDFNFYRIRMTRAVGPNIKVDYLVSGDRQWVKGSRDTQAVLLDVTPLGKPPAKSDFSLLGLEGNITILFDLASGIPLQLRGDAPRIGFTNISLRGASFRETEE